MSEEARTFSIVLAVLAVAVAAVFGWDAWRQREAGPVVHADGPADRVGVGAVPVESNRVQSAGATVTASPGARTCSHCGETIVGSALTVDGGIFHPEHFLCADCSKPIEGAYSMLDGRYLHYACAVERSAPRCAVCEQKLVNMTVLEDFWGNVYHAEHQDDVPLCEYCGRFFADSLNNQGRLYPDGRPVCGLCLETAVSDLERAQALLVETAGVLAGVGLVVEPDWIQLHLVDRKTLAGLADAAHAHARGVTVFRAVDPRVDIIKKNNRNVYVLDGMPETEVRATLAHELVHIWQGELRRLGSDPAFLEGSCNYATWLLLAGDDGDRARYLRHTLDEDPDPVYGEGFRRVRRFADSYGREAWLERLRSESTLPPGF